MLIATVNASYAQSEQITKDISMYVIPDATDFPPMEGTKTYSLYTNEDGKQFLDGPYCIQCEHPETDYARMLGVSKCIVSAFFYAETNFTKGVLDGEYRSSRKASIDLRSYYGSLDIAVDGNLTCAFLNGEPNGTFNVTINANMGGKTKTGDINANYKNGMLVGKFSSDYDGEYYAGNLTQDGKLTGTWQLNGKEMIFHEGIELGNNSTSAETAEMSKKYAEGQIDEAELYEQGYIVDTNSLSFCEVIPNVIDEYFACQALGDCCRTIRLQRGRTPRGCAIT